MTATQDTSAAVTSERVAVERDYLIGVLVDQACRNRPIGRGQAEQVADKARASILQQIAMADESSFFVQLARGEA